MDVISQLLDESTPDGFSAKIKNNIAFFHDILLASKSDIEPLNDLIRELILLKKNIISKLDYTLIDNCTFLRALLYLATRLGLQSPIQTLFEITKRANVDLPLKLKVALLYLGPYPFVSNIVDNFDSILSLISSEGEEEDDPKVLTAMLVDYFAYLLYNYAESNAEEVCRLQQKINEARQTGMYSFMNNQVVDSLIKCNISDCHKEYKDLIQCLDQYLSCKKVVFSRNEYLIEDEGDYYNSFIGNANYNNIINIAHKMNPRVYNELGRGVAILDSQEQMLQYLYSFGRMHEAKLLSAFETIDFSRFDSRQIELIDWGCGQGIASILFKEFTEKQHCNPLFSSVTLIEPSELCIKRAALHVREIVAPVKLFTLNSTLDNLSYDRIKTSADNVKIHLFSNILDVEAFSLTRLISEIQGCFCGDNYFICVSPYVNYMRTNRLDVFMESMQKYPFNLYKKEDVFEGYWSCSKNYNKNKCLNHPLNGCENKWRKVLRVFEVKM